MCLAFGKEQQDWDLGWISEGQAGYREEDIMDGYGKRVLVVEDNEDARQLLGYLLEQENYNVHLAADGLQALQEMKKRHFDAVLSDYHMPRMNGIEFLVLSQVIWPNTPVILLSGDAQGLTDYVIERGAFAWVRKPYETQHMLRVLHAATQQSPEDRWKHMETRMSG
jgi:two-component system, chemotaxis family, chemotaxis protein CheY